MNFNNLKSSLDSLSPMKDKGGEVFILLSPGKTGNTSMILGYATTPVGEYVKEHRHPESEECFFVIQGKGRIYFETGEQLDFKKNDAIRVPKNLKHKIQNTGNEILCVVFASGPLAGSMTKGHINEVD